MDNTTVKWVSACSADQPSCVEVAAVEGHSVLVRDSKDADPNRVLVFSRAEWSAFLAGAQSGRFDAI